MSGTLSLGEPGHSCDDAFRRDFSQGHSDPHIRGGMRKAVFPRAPVGQWRRCGHPRQPASWIAQPCPAGSAHMPERRGRLGLPPFGKLGASRQAARTKHRAFARTYRGRDDGLMIGHPVICLPDAKPRQAAHAICHGDPEPDIRQESVAKRARVELPKSPPGSISYRPICSEHIFLRLA